LATFRPPPIRRFSIWCHCDNPTAFLGEAGLRDGVKGQRGNAFEWTIVDRQGVDLGGNRVVLECPTCGRRHERDVAVLVHRRETEEAPLHLVV
jgi:hypothetical protein